MMSNLFIDDGLKIPQIESGMLYHYTSAEGLKGIVAGKELWVTDSAFLNDSKEFCVANEVFCELIKTKISDSRIAEEFVKEFDAQMLMLQWNTMRSEDRCYVLSCCQECDSLVMWSEYSDFMGYCMELDFKTFLQAFDDRITFHGKVIYTHDEQIDILERYIENSIFSDEANAESVKSWVELGKCDAEKRSGFISEMSVVCFLCNMFFKYECFKQEQEYRFVFYGFSRDLINPPSIDLDYKIKGNTIIPFIKVHTPDDIGLKRVLIGPMNKADIAEMGLKSWFEYLNMSTKVEKSKIPLRY